MGQCGPVKVNCGGLALGGEVGQVGLAKEERGRESAGSARVCGAGAGWARKGKRLARRAWLRREERAGECWVNAGR